MRLSGRMREFLQIFDHPDVRDFPAEVFPAERQTVRALVDRGLVEWASNCEVQLTQAGKDWLEANDG